MNTRLILLMSLFLIPMSVSGQYSVHLKDDLFQNVTTFRIGDTIHIEVSDFYKSGSVNVFLTSNSEESTEEVVLTETGPSTRVFQGSIPTSSEASGIEDGILSVSWGDFIVVQYFTTDFDFNPIVLTDDAYMAGTVLSGVYESSETWNLEGSPYLLTGDVTYTAGTVLTIEPGVAIYAQAGVNDQDEFDPLLSLTVHGDLVAVGDETDHITFQSTAGVDATEQWGGIVITGDGSKGNIRYVNIKHANSGVWFGNNWAESGISLSIVYSTITYSNNGVYIEFAPFADIYVAVTHFEQIVNWAAYADYVPNGSATIVQNTMQSVRQGLYLFSIGFSNVRSNRMVGMNEADDFSYGLSTAYTTSMDVTSNDIQGFNHGMLSGSDNWTPSDITIRDNFIHQNRIYGVFLDGVNAQMDSNRVVNNLNDGMLLSTYSDNPVLMNFHHNTITGNVGNGIKLANDIRPVIQYSNIHSNGGYDVLIETQTLDAIDMRFNWWGDDTYGQIVGGSNPSDLTTFLDYWDNPSLDEVIYTDWATSEIDITPYVPSREVTFQVDVRFAEGMGIFQPGVGDLLFLRGEFNGWDSGIDELVHVSETLYETTRILEGAEGNSIQYKFFIQTGDDRMIDGDGWEGSVGPGENGNRLYELGADQQTVTLETVYFDNRIPVPTLNSPVDQAIDVELNTTLAWHPVLGIEGYTLLLDTIATFSGPILVESTTDTFFDLSGNLETGKTYYWIVRSDFEGIESAWSETWSFETVGNASPITFPVTMEEPEFDWVNLIVNFGGGQLTKVENPDKSGLNTSDQVLRMVKEPGEIYGGSFFRMSEPIDFTTMNEFKVMVWSPRADARLLFKVENDQNSTLFLEVDQTIGVANTWTELTYDFSVIDTEYDYSRVVFIFDLGTVGDGTSDFTFYVDDIRHVEAEAPPLVLHLPFSTQYNDSSAYSLNATSFNAQFIADRMGQPDQALYLNGANAHITVPDSPAFPDEEITISFWFRRFVPSDVLEKYISKELAFQTYMTDENRFFSGFYTGEPGVWSAYETPILTLDPNRWHHYAFSFSNSTGMARSYLNGSLVAEFEETNPANFLKTSENDLYIGRNGSLDMYHVDGGIDEVRIHNRALSAAEILSMYDTDLDQNGVTVYPGDVNRDEIVDARDLLNIGLFYGESGPASYAPGQTWARYRRAVWPSDSGTPRRVHADANGDGYIDSQDIIPIGLNYGLDAGQAGVAKAVQSVAVDSVLVYADVVTSASGTLILRFTQPEASALYAVSALLDFTGVGEFTGQPALITTQSTLDPNLTFKRWVAESYVFDLTVTRTDREEVDSQGILFEVGLPRTVSESMAQSTRITRFNAVNASGVSVPIRLQPRYGTITSVPEPLDRPTSTSLLQNYPNPFNPITLMRWQLAESSHVRIQVYDLLGRHVSTVAEGIYSVGTHSIPFNATSIGLSSGVYIYVLTVQITESNVVEQYHRKMVLIK